MSNLSKFHETLNELMQDKCVNAETLSKTLKVASMTIYRYLSNSRTPTVKNLIKLADYFYCSIDYLVGREETNHLHTFKQCPPFKESFAYVLEKFKISEYKFSKGSGISRGRTFDWLSGKSEPTLDSLIKTANFFECTIDFLIGRER